MEAINPGPMDLDDFPNVLYRQIGAHESRMDPSSRRRAHELQRRYLGWQRDLNRCLEHESSAERTRRAHRALRGRYRTRRELREEHTAVDRSIQTGSGRRTEFLDLVARREATGNLYRLLDQCAVAVEGTEAMAAFRRRYDMPGFLTDAGAADLRSEVERVLQRFPDGRALAPDARMWTAQCLVRDLYFSLRLSEMETLIQIGHTDLDWVAMEAMDALLNPGNRVGVEALGDMLVEAERTAEQGRTEGEREHAQLRAIGLLRQVRSYSLLRFPDSRLSDRLRRIRRAQVDCCRAFMAWRALQDRPGCPKRRGAVLRLLNRETHYGMWPFARELETARREMEEEMLQIETVGD